MKIIARAALTAALLLGSASTVLAHAHLVAQVPAADTQVLAAPDALSLTFSEELEIGFSGITLKGPDGANVPTDKPALSPETPKRMMVPLDGAIAPGRYDVEWHVLSKDGHRTQGTYSFSIGP